LIIQVIRYSFLFWIDMGETEMPDGSDIMDVNLLDPTRESSDEALVAIMKGMGRKARDRHEAALARLREKRKISAMESGNA